MPFFAIHMKDVMEPVQPYIFQTDPGRHERWWWLVLPVVLTIILSIILFVAPDWYNKYIHPEGYGFLELTHFFIPLAGFILAIYTALKSYAWKQKLHFYWLIILGLGCFYIAGEEHSWGQHFFHWGTPDAWGELNRQNETNLHNVMGIFNQLPESILLTGVFVGGLLLPLIGFFKPHLIPCQFAIYIPANALVPTAFLAIFFQLTDLLSKEMNLQIFPRTSEVMETFLYMFILYYIIVFGRRLKEQHARGEAPSQ